MKTGVNYRESELSKILPAGEIVVSATPKVAHFFKHRGKAFRLHAEEKGDPQSSAFGFAMQEQSFLLPRPCVCDPDLTAAS